jgi:GTPase SAR1 family protein
MNLVQRPAFGQTAQIGTLYDARSDAFLAVSLFASEPPPSSGSSKPLSEASTCASFASSYRERLALLNVEPEFGASILAGLVDPVGSGSYLRRIHHTPDILQAALQHTHIVQREKLDFLSSPVRDLINSDVFQDTNATHVVIGVEWGAQIILTIHHWRCPNSSALSDEQFKAKVEKISQAIRNPARNIPSDHSDQLELSAYGNSLCKGGIVLTDIAEAINFLNLIPVQVSQRPGGKGWPISYAMLPISTLALFLGIHVNAKTHMKPFVSIDSGYLNHMFDLFHRLDSDEQRLCYYRSSIHGREQYLPEDHSQEVQHHFENTSCRRKMHEEQFRKLLLQIRGGDKGPSALRDFQDQVVNEMDCPTWFEESTAAAQVGKLDFVSRAVTKMATYIGYNGVHLEDFISQNIEQDTFILLFNSAAFQSQEPWESNKAMLLYLLESPENTVVIVDCDATGEILPRPRICCYKDGKEVVSDFVAHVNTLETESLAQCDETSLELKVPKPLNSRPVNISCPGRACLPEKTQGWLCRRCLQPLEYGHTDQYIYCDCGRSLYSNFSFQCSSERHGREYRSFHAEDLLSKLTRLEEASCLNILILGETGVGKSTFINAFVNYLTFETLDDAKSEPLNWVIPCSFSIQRLDRSGDAKEIEKFDVKVGDREDEQDGSKGLSATQQTTVYPVKIGSNTIRLIDTPGIGDTRGISYDKKNMADLLSTLSGYENLHGILVLLKSNSARLTVSFNFCMKELLTHLHRSAAANMAFGFTNTRITNYTPGDTFGPLSTLLVDHADIGLSLTSKTAYCFDSESFRYLAAFKKNVPMDNEEDYRRSWNHSREEAMRLLEYFKSKPPHSVKSTVSLHGARQLVLALTKPMAEISQIIQRNISICEDKMLELQDTRLTGDKLRSRLHLDKMQLDSRKLDQPRTVCADTSCVEYKSDGKEEDKVVIVYKTHCHSSCYLTDVTADQIAHPGLIQCAAFSGNTYCDVCSHHWQKHLHVLYELEESIVSVMDTEVERQLVMNANDIMLRDTAIKELEERLKEYRDEHDQIQETTAKFGLFLKKNSITPYNDATLAYLDVLIRNEEEKMQAGGNKGRWQSLQQDRTRHTELVKVLTNNMKSGCDMQDLDEKHIEQLVAELYQLKHFGGNLKSVSTTISSAHQATYRERPHRVGNKSSRGLTAWLGWAETPKRASNMERKPGNETDVIPWSSDATNKVENGVGASSLSSGFKYLIRNAPALSKKKKKKM